MLNYKNIDENIRIILRDNLLKIEQDITDSIGYSFLPDNSNVSSRFSLKFMCTSNTTKIADNLSTEPDIEIYINLNN